MIRALILLVAVFPTIVDAASVSYELYDFTENETGNLVASGTKSYKHSDVEVIERAENPEEIWWEKILWLEKGYGIGASIHREDTMTGFGLTGELVCEKYKCPFSWEWFRQASGNKFSKLQESGSVRIETRPVNKKVEISRIEFLSDVSLRINATRKEVGAVTHRILIKKGSVLEYAP